MDRRSFLTAGSGLAVAGVAATALVPKPALAARTGAPTVFDFGAVGDGNTDDSAAFAKALSWGAQNGGYPRGPPPPHSIPHTTRGGGCRARPRRRGTRAPRPDPRKYPPHSAP